MACHRGIARLSGHTAGHLLGTLVNPSGRSLYASRLKGTSQLSTLLSSFYSTNTMSTVAVQPMSSAATGATRSTGFALRYHEHGAPTDVIQYEQENILDLKKNFKSPCHVRMLAAAINPSDINQIEGTYGRLPSQFPAVAGLEGVGRVISVPENCTTLKAGDIVIPAGAPLGTWRTDLVGEVDNFQKMPTDIPINQLAVLRVNPCTAYRMLRDFVSLKEGEYVLQNGANSAVGKLVIQLARAWNLKTINIVRDRPDIETLKSSLTKLGADVVWTEQELRSKGAQYFETVGKPRLALNCVGGKNATEMTRHLAQGGTMVTYGGMGKEPMQVTVRALVFQDVAFRGFWMTRWGEEHTKKEWHAMLINLCEFIRQGRLQTETKGYPLTMYKEALKEAMSSYKSEKIIFEMGDVEP